MRAIDLNGDLGEGAGHDVELMPLLTSANIACGAHAGDAATMRATVRLAIQHGVGVGAHPGFADRPHGGRREIPTTPAAVRALVLTQVRLLQTIAEACGTRVSHVKPHGALYNQAARDPALAEAVARATYEAGPQLGLFGLAGSASIAAGRACGLRVAQEVFADRTYQADGSLTPREHPDAFIRDEDAAVRHVLQMVRTGTVRSLDGRVVPLVADTVCLHGDGPQALAFARRLREALATAQITVRAWDR